MKKNKLLAVLLSLTVVLATLPAATSTAEAEDNSNSIAVQATTGWQPKATRTVKSGNFPINITKDETVQINGPVTYTAPAGTNPITVASGVDAKIIINGSVTLNGANASGTTGATAAIYVPSSSTLTIYSAHDEYLSTRGDAPQDTLTLKGGDAAAGGNGSNAKKIVTTKNGTLYSNWYIGAGGNGGGGAAAAIGGNGGNGGNGGAAKTCNVELSVNSFGHWMPKGDDHKGASGNNGADGTAGTSSGKINISGRLALNATGGAGGSGGSGGSGCGGQAETSDKDDMVGGCGGGGGGGGGLAAPAIGAGGAGGSGGGSGGELSSDHNGDVQGCGGGGGGGGWPNGGGGGGGGAECSDAETKNDNKSYGGAGGAGGAAGASGNAGKAGHSTGTNKHGINNDRYDAEPGAGGAGGYGVASASTAGGGAGGTERHHKYNAGAGGSGGKYTSKTSWNTQGNLIFSTASKLNLSSSLSYEYGDGQGYGTLMAMTPYIVYDLMDCKISLAECTYPGEDDNATTKITSITYNSGTDRDKSIIGSSKTIATNRVSLEYTNRKHCSSGTVAVTGANNSTRTTVMTNNAVIGVSNLSFDINKATINNVPITGDFVGKTQGTAIPISVSTYRTSSTAAYKDLSTLCKSSGGTGTPTVQWSVTSGNGTFTNANRSSTTFTPTSAGSITIKVALSGMNDFKDYSKTITLSTTKKDLDSLTFSTNTPHPRNDVSVILPDDVGDNATIQWYTVTNSTVAKISGATDTTYTVRNADIGKSLRVKVTPTANSNYNVNTTTATISNTVENHNYTQHNGFCTKCGEYQPASTITSGTYNGYYNIANGGQLFWFAAMVNDDPTHAEFNKQNTSANAVLSQDIDLENRDWTPIGERTTVLTYKQLGDVNDNTKQGDVEAVEANAYEGTFTSNGATRTISNLEIAGQHLRAGLFATARNEATLENFIVEGKITLPEENKFFTSRFNCVGGVAGKMNGTKISGVVSNVDIVNTNGNYKHVGGIIGEVQNELTQIEKCLYKGEIHIINSNDCVGGIVGYSNKGARIRYCANLGIVSSVKGEATASPYAGGILGYVNNTDATVKNCYNYGTVSNGGLSYEGAIVGCIKSGKNENFTDNYYLEGSASNSLGHVSANITPPTAKSKAAFASGEVCYLVNGKTSDPDKAIWRQNIDNTRTPYDSYPLLWTYSDSIVYYRSDDTYSNYKEDVNVDISWGAMSFKYTDGDWNPDDHSYDDGTWEPTANDANKITVTNNSTVAVIAGFKFIPDSNSGLTNFTSTFSGNTPYRLEKKGTSGNKNITTTQLTLSSDKPTNTFTDKKLGTITITITAAGGNS